MKTRYSSLVTIKKSSMQKSERLLQSANADLNNANIALELSYNALQDINLPQTGSMSEFLASRTLLDSGRGLVEHNKGWINFAKNQVRLARETLKLDMIAYEKFKYLDLEEIKKMLKEIQIQEAKDLDEVALMTYAKKKD